MNDIQLRRLDAGLLLVFEAALRLGNLARVAETLGLTPSAISHGLARLREIFGDPLFERRAQGVLATPRALALAPQIESALAALRGALQEGGAFRPERIDRVFQIVSLDGPIASLVPRLLARLSAEAPKARLAFRSLGREDARKAVREGRADLAIGVFGPPGPREISRALGPEQFVVVARAGHPGIGERLTLEAWLETDHILVSAAGDLIGAVDAALAARNLSRRVRAAMPQFLAAFATVAASDATATVTQTLAQDFAAPFGLRLHAPPIDLAPFELTALTAKGAPDPALDWLVDQIAEIRRESGLARTHSEANSMKARILGLSSRREG